MFSYTIESFAHYECMVIYMINQIISVCLTTCLICRTWN